MKPVGRQAIVLTGASSGIGLATTRAAAARGARFVIGSRSGETLVGLVEQVQSEGGEAIYAVIDVSKRELSWQG